MSGLLPSAVILGIAAGAALVLARLRGPTASGEAQRAAARALAVTVVLQAAHFLEEAGTGFPQRFGELLGLPSMPIPFFLAFNVVWLVIWVAAVVDLPNGRKPAFFAAWFLGIAGAANGVLHPVAAVVTGRYFPGVVTSPLVGAAALWLMQRLARATGPRGIAGNP